MRKEYKEFRKTLPAYNNGRKVVACDATSKLADRLCAMASPHYSSLFELYNRPSFEKVQIEKECFEMYRNDPGSFDYHLCGGCVQNFTVAWQTPETLVVLTRDTEYIMYRGGQF